jgi:hypothetical protein
MSDLDPREFGRLEAEVQQLKDIVSEIRSDLKDMKKNWDEAKGGMRVLLGVAAVIGAVSSQLIHWILGK